MVPVRSVQPSGLIRVEDVTRRGFMLGALGAALLIACGDEDDGEDEGSGRRIPHKFGETVVPLSPQRIVTVGYDEHDLLLGFGVVPLMQRDYWGDQPYGTWPWAQGALGSARPELIQTEEIPYERIIALKPDLIMATWAGLEKEQYDRLAAIAPTVAQHPDYEDWEAPWDVRAIRVGAILGKEDEARAKIRQIEERIAGIREAHPEWRGLEAVPTTVGDSTFSVTTTAHSRSKLLQDLGFVIPEDVVGRAKNEFNAEFSFEEVRILDPAQRCAGAGGRPVHGGVVWRHAGDRLRVRPGRLFGGFSRPAGPAAVDAPSRQLAGRSDLQ